MALHAEWVRYGADEEWSGYFAAIDRAAAPLPGLVVFQEAWGVDAHIEDVARRFARAGYAVLAPDLFARHGRRPAALERTRLAEAQALLNSLPSGSWREPAARAQALAAFGADAAARIEETLGVLFSSGGPLAATQHLPAAAAALAWLREAQPRSRGAKVATIGFCMGGALSALVGCREPDVAVSLVFYGSSPAPAEAARAGRIVGFYGAADAHVNPTIAPFEAAMREAGRPFDVHMYEGAGHAFFNDNRPSYHATAARHAFATALDVLVRALG
jgi:carboxymethylenebutenolidase